MTKTDIVYVKLVGEGVNVWRPVEAEQLDYDRWRLVEDPPEEETWPFAKDDVVRCERRKLSGGEVLVALEQAPI